MSSGSHSSREKNLPVRSKKVSKTSKSSYFSSSRPPTYGSEDYVQIGCSLLKSTMDDSLDYSIDAIVLGNGAEVAGRKLLKGRWYASSAEVRNPQTYFEIDIESFSFDVIRAGDRTGYPTIDLAADSTDPPNVFWCESISSKRQSTRACEMTLKLKTFCQENPGLGVFLGGVGERETNGELKSYWIQSIRTLAAAKDFWCVPNAIAHGILRVCGYEVALRSLAGLAKFNRKFKSFKPIGDTVRGLGLKLCVRKPSNYGLLKRKIEDKRLRSEMIAEVCSWNKGIWIVRLRSPSPHSADHCICVDAGSQIILDGGEPYALRLSEASLRGCVGPNNSEAFVADFLEIHK